MKKTKKFSGKFSLLTIFMLLMSIITMDVYAAKLPFTDVPEKSWYYDDVKSAYESDLISGKKATKYAPNDNMTAAEAVKLAATMYMLKNEGKVNFSPSKPWYKVYVDYAKQKNLITDDLDWNKKITRAGYMQIFANILTDEEAKKNEVADGSIPDVPMTHPNAQAIYKLYRAGIVTGVDEKKNCSPASNIKRNEVAAILIRMMDKKRRLGFSLSSGTTPPGTTTPPGGTTPPPGGTTPPPSTNPLNITKQPVSVKGRERDLVTLEVQVEGGKEPYSYQWQYRKVGDRNYTNSMSGGNTTNTLKPPVEIDIYDYRCVITDANGDKVTSADARVEKEALASPLKITKHPQSIVGKFLTMVTLEVAVEGGKAPYNYQWEERKVGAPNFKNSSSTGSTTNALSVGVNDLAYDYRCVITDAKGDKVTSNEARVEVDTNTIPLRVVKHPRNIYGKEGDTVTLEVEVDGGKKPYSYQWKKRKVGTSNYVISDDEGNRTTILKPVIESVACAYACVITDAKGNTVNSSPALVGVDVEAYPLKITEQPENASDEIGRQRILEVKVEGGRKPYSYQWQYADPMHFKDSMAVGNKTSRLLTTVGKDIIDYRCIITDANKNQVISRTARVYKRLKIVSRTPEGNDIKKFKGEKVNIEIEVDGGMYPYEYQWKYVKLGDPVFYDVPMGQVYSRDTKTTLSVTVKDEVCTYWCEITDYYGHKLPSTGLQVIPMDIPVLP